MSDLLVCLSGRSAVGKTAIAIGTGMRSIISFTSRPMREGEIEGVSYCFRNREWFQDNLWRFTIDLVEFGGNYYGMADSDLLDGSGVAVMTFDKALEMKNSGIPVFLVWVSGLSREERAGRDVSDDDRLESLFEANRNMVDLVLLNDSTVDCAVSTILNKMKEKEK